MTPPPHSARRRTPDCPDSLRQEILDAARELFATEGYGSVSLRKIAQRVGCTPMAIYCHFEDKADILDCICEETFTRFATLSDRLDKAGLPPGERVRQGLRNYVEFGLAHPHHYQLTFMTPLREPQALGRREQIGRRAFERLRGHVAACLAEGGVSPDPQAVEVASQLAWATVHGLTSLLIARPDFPWAERERLIATAVESAVESLSCAGRQAPAATAGRTP
ncbi:MAG TPA: TetR/AcrR family transcriptional regulator [Thermoanaerobaculia bacterium]|nr:TetR/AcrR family transcriptional regulator [Thermoanaerobaculia bacterium]